MILWRIGKERQVEVDKARMLFTANTPWSKEEIAELRTSQAIRSVESQTSNRIMVAPSCSGEVKEMAIRDVKGVVTRTEISKGNFT